MGNMGGYRLDSRRALGLFFVSVSNRGESCEAQRAPADQTGFRAWTAFYLSSDPNSRVARNERICLKNERFFAWRIARSGFRRSRENS
jgi:hypothetical protein